MHVAIITSWRSYEYHWYWPMVFIWSSRRDDCNIHFIKTHCFSNVSIDRNKSMALFNTLDLTHWTAWGNLLSTWKHKYPLPSGGKCVVFGNSTGAIVTVLINGVKQGCVDLAWTLIFCFWGVTHEWISSVFNISDVFWIVILSSFSSWDDINVCDELVVSYLWFAEDDNAGFLSVVVGIFDQLYLQELPIPFPMVPMSTINQIYDK